MKRILLYGAGLAVFVLLLKWLEYRYWVHDLSMEVYIGLIAIVFVIFGIWIGLRLTRKQPIQEDAGEFVRNDKYLSQVGISEREYDVLVQLSRGLSNQEIADTLFVSSNTVKTHISNLYSKLNVKRRTQAVQLAKERRLIP